MSTSIAQSMRVYEIHTVNALSKKYVQSENFVSLRFFSKNLFNTSFLYNFIIDFFREF